MACYVLFLCFSFIYEQITFGLCQCGKLPFLATSRIAYECYKREERSYPQYNCICTPQINHAQTIGWKSNLPAYLLSLLFFVLFVFFFVVVVVFFFHF